MPCPPARRPSPGQTVCRLSLALTASLLACTEPSPAHAQARVVGTVSNLVPDTLTLSPDGKRFAVVTVDPRSKLRRVIVDGKPLPKVYDSIAQGMPFFSPDSQHVIFAAKIGPRCYVVIDGTESEGYLLARDGWPLSDLVVSPHGRYVAYKARVEGKTVQVVGAQKFGPYEVSLDAEGNRLWGVWDFTFSSDGEFFAYRAKVGDQMVLCTGKVLVNQLSVSPPYDSIGSKSLVPVPGQGPGVFGFIACKGDKEYVALWNGKEVPLGNPYDAIVRGSVVRPPHDPRRLDYYANKGKQLLAVVAGKEEALYDKLGPLMYAADGRHAYAAQKGKAVVVVVQGVEGPPFEGVRYPRAGSVFSPDGKTVAYVGHAADGERVVVNGKPAPLYDHVDPASLTYSPDGKRFAYVAEHKGKWFLVLDGKAGPEYDAVDGLCFSPDSSCLFHRGRKGLDQFFILEDQPLGPFADLSPDSPVFSGDSRRMAFAALKDGQWRVVLDGKEGPPCDGIVSRLTFSEDGFNHLAYVAKFLDQGKPAFALVANGKPGKLYDAIWMGAGGRLPLDATAPGYFARKGLLVYRDTITWPNVFLSDLKYVKGTSGQGAPKRDQNTAGNPLLLGRQYSKGIGTYAPSEIVYDLNPLTRWGDKKGEKLARPAEARFVAVVGVDDGGSGSVVFQVYADDRKLAESPLLRRGGLHRFNVPIPAEARQLRLVVTDGGDGKAGDWADWADAGLIFDGQ